MVKAATLPSSAPVSPESVPPLLQEFKGMVHMITMLTYIAQIGIGEYKNPL